MSKTHLLKDVNNVGIPTPKLKILEFEHKIVKIYNFKAPLFEIMFSPTIILQVRVGLVLGSSTL